MSALFFRFLIVGAAMCAAAAPALAQGSGRCTNEALTIEGQKVSAQFCVTGEAAAGPNKPVHVTISESLSAGGSNVNRTAGLDFVAADAARAIDDIPLAPLGIKKTLHSTFLYSGGSVKLEHALLVPGAVTVK